MHEKEFKEINKRMVILHYTENMKINGESCEGVLLLIPLILVLECYECGY